MVRRLDFFWRLDLCLFSTNNSSITPENESAPGALSGRFSRCVGFWRVVLKIFCCFLCQDARNWSPSVSIFASFVSIANCWVIWRFHDGRWATAFLFWEKICIGTDFPIWWQIKSLLIIALDAWQPFRQLKKRIVVVLYCPRKSIFHWLIF